MKGAMMVVFHSTGDNGLDYRFEAVVQLKKGDDLHNAIETNKSLDKCIQMAVHNGFPEDFVRCVWSRSMKDRVRAAKECFKNTNVEKKEKPPEPDLFA